MAKSLIQLFKSKLHFLESTKTIPILHVLSSFGGGRFAEAMDMVLKYTSTKARSHLMVF